MPESRFVRKCYNMMLKDDADGYANWVTGVRSCLERNGFGIVWQNQMVASESMFLRQFVNRLEDCFLQDWNSNIITNHKLSFYSHYKTEFNFEKYLEVLDIRKFRFTYTNFRIGSHDLEIERGRYRKIPRENRICRLCNSNTIEDEYHFLLCCDFYNDIRASHIPRKYYTLPNIHKFYILMSSKNENIIRTTATYLLHAFKRRQQIIVHYQND